MTPRLDVVIARPACRALTSVREGSGLQGPKFTADLDEATDTRLEHPPVHQPPEEEARKEGAGDDDEGGVAGTSERGEDERLKDAKQDCK